MKKHLLLPSLVLLLSTHFTFGQNDLESMMNEEEVEKKEFTTATFKATRVINLQSTEKVNPGTLQFVIQHRFGPVNGGYYELFGFDQATIRFGFEYGLNKFITLGLGRSSLQKNVDGMLKVSLVRQATGPSSLPFSLLYFSSVTMNGMKWADPNRENYFSSRLSYVHQVILGRKFSKRLSLEIVPSAVHRNLVVEATEQNLNFAVGSGGRFKISNRLSINAEYIYRIPPKDPNVLSYTNNFNSLSVGIDVETGGHVFQLHLSNSLPMIEKGFILETNESWEKGGIHIGFNITRDFVINKKAKK